MFHRWFLAWVVFLGGFKKKEPRCLGGFSESSFIGCFVARPGLDTKLNLQKAAISRDLQR